MSNNSIWQIARYLPSSSCPGMLSPTREYADFSFRDTLTPCSPISYTPREARLVNKISARRRAHSKRIITETLDFCLSTILFARSSNRIGHVAHSWSNARVFSVYFRISGRRIDQERARLFLSI